MPEHQQTQQSNDSKSAFQKQAIPTTRTPISNPMAIIQRAKINPKSLTHADVMQLQRTIGNRAVGKLLSEIGLIPSKAKQASSVQMQTIPEETKEPLQGKMTEAIQRQEIPEEEEPLQGKMIETVQRQEIPEEEEPLQGKMADTVQRQEIPEEEEPHQGKFEGETEQEACPSCSTSPIQRERENHTGMPDNLKAGVENFSGIDMSDVRVHYNSDKPAEVGALAYTQGTNIHVAPGQEKHLPHEAWHVVQQAQGRVRPTMQLKDGVPVNNDEGLEREADVIGERAFTSGRDIFFRQRTHQHGSRGQKLVAHELTHIVQQNWKAMQHGTTGGKLSVLKSFSELRRVHHQTITPTIQCLVDRNSVETNVASLINELQTQGKYERVKPQYEALLRGLDTYHTVTSTEIVEKNKDGINGFRGTMLDQIMKLRDLCFNLTLADDDCDLDNPVVNYVLDSLNEEENTIKKITGYFSQGIPIQMIQAWNSQFAENTYSRAIEIAKFALPLYESRKYIADRAFIESEQDMEFIKLDPMKRRMKGYKLHVSIDEASMIKARDTLLPFLENHRYKHKIVASHSLMTGGQEGKIVTIYPNTMEEVTNADGFNHLIEEIEREIGNWGLVKGSPVQNETPVGNSGFIYREKDARYIG